MISTPDSAPFDDEDDVDDMAPPSGDFDIRLSDEVRVTMARRGQALVVSFESGGPRQPLAAVAQEMDWSVLTFTSDTSRAFRSEAVVGFFDALVDGTFLDEFEPVLFSGAGADADAAMGFALCAPASRCLVLGPPDAPSRDGRYPVDPGTLGAADQVYLVYDPRDPEEVSHAEAIDSEGPLHRLRCRFPGRSVEEALSLVQAYEDVLTDAMTGDLTPVQFYRALRSRRSDPGYLRTITARLIEQDRPLLEALLLRNVARRTGRKRFAQRLEKLTERLEAEGIRLPPERA